MALQNAAYGSQRTHTQRLFLLISCVFMQMSANDSSPLYLLNDNYLGNVGCARNQQ